MSFDFNIFGYKNEKVHPNEDTNIPVIFRGRYGQCSSGLVSVDMKVSYVYLGIDYVLNFTKVIAGGNVGMFCNFSIFSYTPRIYPAGSK